MKSLVLGECNCATKPQDHPNTHAQKGLPPFGMNRQPQWYPNESYPLIEGYLPAFQTEIDQDSYR